MPSEKPQVEEGRVEQEHWIEDRALHRYQVTLRESASWWRFKVFDGAVRVGQANCKLGDGGLMIDDLLIEKAAYHPEFGFLASVRRLLNWRKPTANYRNRGLGTALLKLIVEQAGDRGLAEIKGSISPRDLRENPTLPEWFRRRGFTVEPGGIYHSGAIRMKLPRKENATPGGTA